MSVMTPKRGAIASPRSHLAAATPHTARYAPPPNSITVPSEISMWGNDVHGDCVTAEEAFAKACNSPEIFVPDSEVIAWATQHGVLEGAYITQVLQWMQSGGFSGIVCNYNDGPYLSVDWTNSANLQSAICQGPVKIGVAADQIETAWRQTGGQSGWFGTGFQPDPNEDHCVSLCGYGTLAWLAQQLGVNVPAGVDRTANGYALFTWNSIGIIDEPSMIAVTHEAWLRQPTSVTQPRHGLFVFHQGTQNCGQLWGSAFDGTTWQRDTDMPNVGIVDGSSAVVFNSKVYVFHQGNAGDLWYSVFDGTTWQTDTLVVNVGIVGAPSAVVFNSQLYVFHQGNAGDLWYSVFDGTTWQTDTNVVNVGIVGAPSAVVFNSQLYVFHQGNVGDLWYSVLDGTTWQTDTNVPNVGIVDGPSAVVFNSALYVFHQGNAGDLWYSVFDGTNWQNDTNVPNVGVVDGPSAVVFNSALYVFHQGNAGDLWYSVLDGTTWQADANVPNVGISASPSAVYWSGN